MGQRNNRTNIQPGTYPQMGQFSGQFPSQFAVPPAGQPTGQLGSHQRDWQQQMTPQTLDPNVSYPQGMVPSQSQIGPGQPQRWRGHWNGGIY